MTFDDFIKKWMGKPVDVDGIYPNQCFDLFHQYHIDVLGLTDKSILAFPSAYQIFTDFNRPDLFEKIINTPTGVPQKGDIVVWGKTIGQWGHVAIFINGDANKFNSFDANWPTGTLPHIQQHDYTGVLGWLRVKTLPQQDCDPNWRIERDKNWQLYQGQLETNRVLVEQNTQLERSRDEYKKQFSDEQIKSQGLRDALDKQTEADANTGAELLEAQQKADAYKHFISSLSVLLGLPETADFDVQCRDIAERIKILQKPQDDTEKEYLKLVKALEDFIYKHKPKAKNIWQRIVNFILRK